MKQTGAVQRVQRVGDLAAHAEGLVHGQRALGQPL